jgi:flagellar biosynthesis/type III secretory pathway M-ring protein FliF/YscJ
MDVSTQISLDVLLSAGSGIVGAVGAYIKLKSRIDLLEAKNSEQEKELKDVRDRKKEMNTAIHKRIDDIRDDFSELQKETNKGHQRLENNIKDMELRIVKEIHNIVEKLTNK